MNKTIGSIRVRALSVYKMARCKGNELYGLLALAGRNGYFKLTCPVRRCFPVSQSKLCAFPPSRFAFEMLTKVRILYM